MKEDIKISIITPSYNRVDTIEQAICSVLNQTYENVEYIVVDGESTDGTVDILRKYSSRIKWISEKDNGIYDAANKALKMTTGDYIQFIGADDCLKDSNIIQKVVDFIKQNKDVDIICSNRIVVDESNLMQYVQRPNYERVLYNHNLLFWTPHTSLFAKGDLLRKEKFDTRFKMGADYYFILKCFYKNKACFKVFDCETAYFSNRGISSDVEARQEENYKILKELGLDNFCRGPKYTIKNIISKTTIYGIYTQQKIAKNSEIHNCQNAYCRWCGKN